jgi:hypothetical protein
LADTLAMRNTHSTNWTLPLLAALAMFLLLGVVGPNRANATPPPTVTGHLTLGSVMEDAIHFGDGTGYRRPDTAVALLDLTVHNLPGNLTFDTSYRQPLFGASFWNEHIEKFTACLSVPVGRGTAAINYERNPGNGFEWGWVSYSLPFRL